MNACDRAAELRPQAEAELGPKVEDLWRQYVNAWLECNGHPEDYTRNSKDIRDLATEIVGKIDNPFIDVEHTDLQIGAIIAGKENSCSDPNRSAIHGSADPVTSFNGQFVHTATDVTIDGAGIVFVFVRTYKNQVRFPGPLGFNWNHSYNHRLRVAQNTIFRSTGDLQVEPYLRHPKFGQPGFSYYMPPDGQDGVILEHGSSFVWRAPHGVRHVFEQATDPLLHRLCRVEDRHGNYIMLSYDADRLVRVDINHPQRFVTFSYDEQDRLGSMRDFTGRQWSYCYDYYGDLASVTGPATDEYAGGLTVCYEYSSAQFSGNAQHNLTRIIDPAGRIYLENEYGTSPGLLDFNRVVRQRQGGGQYTFEYDDVPPEGDFDYSGEERPAFRTVRTERNGQRVCQLFNRFGQQLCETQRILQQGVVREVSWRYRYNRDGALVGSLSPEGVLTQDLYGREYFIRRHGADSNGDPLTDALTMEERQAFGRLFATVKRGHHYDLSAMNLSRGVWGDIFPDIIAAFDPADAVAKFTYEPTYGQMLTASDPRFTRSADPAVQTAALGEHPRYEETLRRYSYTGPAPNPWSDPTRLLNEIRQPAPTLPDGTSGGPLITRLVEYDPRGRLLRAVAADGVETVHGYFGAADGVREGYRRQTVLDPGGLAITTRYDVDDLGRVIAAHEPRSMSAPPGRFITRTTYNALDQVVAATSSEPFAFVTRRFYDRSGQLVREERDARDENGIDLPDAPEVRTFKYDEELRLIEESFGGADASTRLVKRHQYDCAGSRTATILPEGNRIEYEYEARQLQTAQTIGARTSLAATTRTRYDGDGRVRTLVDARGNGSTFTCDPFGRVVATEDALGNVIRRDYDKRDEMVVKRVFEKRTDGYYLLARNVVDRDELGREIRNTVDRFVVSPGPVPDNQLATAFLTGPIPGATTVATVVFYDAGGHPVRVVDAMQRETVNEYDAAGRLQTSTDPLGNQVVNRYDEHGNVARRDRIDVVRDPDDPAIVVGQRVFSETFTYDELDRRTSRTDSLGNVTETFYDSRGLMVRTVDALGRNVHIAYDIHRRRISQRADLTPTGLGSTPIVQTIEERFEYDRNGNLVRAFDAPGRRMEYMYDALDRRREVVFPDGTRYTLTFDPDGYLAHRRDNRGLQQRFTVDALGRTTRIEVDLSELAAGQVGGASVERYWFDAFGRRTREENDFAAREVAYDSLGAPVSETVTFRDPAAPVSGPLVLQRRFDEAGSLAELTYPNGRTLTFDRDGLGRVASIRNVQNGSSYPGDPSTPDAYEIARFDYAGRQPVRRRNGNGTSTTCAHDAAGRVIEIDHAHGGTSFLRLQYLFDAASDLRRRGEIDGAASTMQSFGYDSMRRLADVRDGSASPFQPSAFAPATTIPPDPLPNRQADIDALLAPLVLPPGTHTYEYDTAGNRVASHDGAPVSYTTNDLDQYTGVDAGTGATSLEYDANGNLIADGVRTYTYDAINRLVRVVEGGVAIFECFHDASGRRIVQRTPEATLQVVWDGWRPIAEYRDGALFAQYVWSVDGGLVQIAAPLVPGGNGAEHWYHTDLVGSVRALTTRGGLQAALYGYEPFGASAGAPPVAPYNPFLFTGKRYDRPLDSYDFHFRQYSPALGRFLQRDPSGTTDGGNLYTYTANSPLASVDPLGLESRPEQREEAIKSYFQAVNERLDKAEQRQLDKMVYVPENKPKVRKVFAAYRDILNEIQKGVITNQEKLDFNALWEKEHNYRGFDWEDVGWMHICSNCQENPSLADVGPFGGQRIAGVDVAAVFRIVTSNQKPNPTLADKIIDTAIKGIILFGPDIAMGMEFGMMKRGALDMGASRAAMLEMRPITETEYFATLPGHSIAMGTYGDYGIAEVYLRQDAKAFGYRTLGTSPDHAAELGIAPPVPDSVRRLGSEAIVEHEVNMFLKPADRVGFWLTGEEHLHPNSITSMELRRHMEDPELFHKTQWFMNDLFQKEVEGWTAAQGTVNFGMTPPK